jgi:hypothetical protein
MALNIETFSNITGGNAFFKAVTHPVAAPKFAGLIARLAENGPVAIYDPHQSLEAIAEFHDFSGIDVESVFVQRVVDVGRTILGRQTKPVTDLAHSRARHLFVASFDSARPIRQIGHLIPDGMTVSSLDDARLPEDMLTDRGRYLAAMNFATNFAFFRDAAGRHTRLVTVNYWAGHGARGVTLWLMLFDRDGGILAEWRETLDDGAHSIAIDSAELRHRFGLAEFTGQLFVHASGIAGHDVFKYALDTYTDDGTEVSCTHDANSWPAERYAGLPAPRPGERVSLWVQNTHPCAIPAGEIGLNLRSPHRTLRHGGDRCRDPVAGYRLAATGRGPGRQVFRPSAIRGPRAGRALSHLARQRRAHRPRGRSGNPGARPPSRQGPPAAGADPSGRQVAVDRAPDPHGDVPDRASGGADRL